MNPACFEIVFAAFAFVLGSIVGSFLNVCIYRMPLGLSVNEPRRSFCPHCKYQIPWFRNLPLFSWLDLRGRCANCGATIPFRYFLVELLTGLAFLAVWLRFPLDFVIPFWILLSLFLVATFIDFDHFIIPDEITWGGAVCGLLLSWIFPALMETDSRWVALLWSAIGAVSGFATLFAVVELGKLAFGKKRIPIEPDTAFSWTRHGEDADLRLGEESTQWSEIFSRESDRLILETKEFSVDDGAVNSTGLALEFHFNRVRLPSGERNLDGIGRIEGKVSGVVIPREAMGFGDVKFIAAIGAFLGWKAVFFTIFSASILGSFVGIAVLLMRRREWSAKIPFGPYLALGATIWMFVGPRLLEWYWNLVTPQF